MAFSGRDGENLLVVGKDSVNPMSVLRRALGIGVVMAHDRQAVRGDTAGSANSDRNHPTAARPNEGLFADRAVWEAHDRRAVVEDAPGTGSLSPLRKDADSSHNRHERASIIGPP